MRGIKFRAWDKKEECMVTVTQINWEEPYGVTISHGGSWHNEVENYHLMQFTGLQDKNGKEIYEGDILSFDGNMTADNSLGIEPNGYIYDENSRHPVIWNTEQACWDLQHDDNPEWKYKRDTHDLMLDSTCIEVVGNIYENPKLKEGI